MPPKIWYLGLEPLAARYTKQLCEEWFPAAIKSVDYDGRWELRHIRANAPDDQIQIGTVLDATGRGIYATAQVGALLLLIRQGRVGPEDVIFLQDFWTPGFEAVIYALDLHQLSSVRVYSMLHAQSVDEYDFTWPMRHWMRPMEVGMSKYHTGVFVASTIHRDQLRAAGFEVPIHVVGLPVDSVALGKEMDPHFVPWHARHNTVVYSSRMDREKNPEFMMRVAEEFLLQFPNYKWVVTTSGKQFRSNQRDVVDNMWKLQGRQPRFVIQEALTKEQYYKILCTAQVQFNCSLQDYVSWTLLEALAAGCTPVYPNFRSFPEVLPPWRMYSAFDVDAALDALAIAVAGGGNENARTSFSALEKCNTGRLLQAQVLCGLLDGEQEINVWQQFYKAITHEEGS